MHEALLLRLGLTAPLHNFNFLGDDCDACWIAGFRGTPLVTARWMPSGKSRVLLCAEHLSIHTAQLPGFHILCK